MINNDLPITRSSQDKLNRKQFVQSLARILSNYSSASSFTIGLYGAWGSGKTSLMNMVLEQVERSDKDIIILRFNPWLCSDPKQMINQFFKQLSVAVKLKSPVKDVVWKLIDEYADVFMNTAIASLINVKTGGLFRKLVHFILKGRPEKNDDLQAIKAQIVQELLQKKRKIIVSIDDIDRLSDCEIIAVFQLVKALADFPNTIYLLAFDYDVVIHALSKVQYGDGKEYLEKIVQMPFEIPEPTPESIQESFTTKLDEIVKDIPENRWNPSEWQWLYHYGLKSYIHTFRDVNRFTNTFSLKYGLLKEETNPIDLLGITTLQVFEPQLYSKLSYYKDILCGGNSWYSAERQAQEKNKIEKGLRILLGDGSMLQNPEAAENILGILFPKVTVCLDSAHGTWRGYEHNGFLVDNRVAVSACFERYFSFLLEEEAVSSTVIYRMLYEADENAFAGALGKLYEDGKIVPAFQKIQAYVAEQNRYPLPLVRSELIIRCLMEQWHLFKVKETGLFSYPFAWRLISCVEALLKGMEEPERYVLLRQIFENKKIQIPTLALILQKLEQQHGRFTDRKESERETLLILEHVSELEKIFKSRGVEALDSGIALEQQDGLNFLWLLEQIAPEIVSDRKKKLISDNWSFAKIISYCCSSGAAEIGMTVKQTRHIDLKRLETFISLEDADHKAQNLVKKRLFQLLSEEDQRNIVTFLLKRKQKKEYADAEYGISEDRIQEELDSLRSGKKRG